jgi:hypothetical protein
MMMHSIYTKEDLRATLDSFGMKDYRIEEDFPNELKIVFAKPGWWRIFKKRKIQKCVEYIKERLPATIYLTHSLEKV